MRGAGLVACVVLAGCNAVFGLDPTVSIDPAAVDFDKDGVPDVHDNCPTLANDDQANSDGDAFGDACDTCPTVMSATTHDEDQDGAGDACDACPGVPDFANDTDGDGVGDICDPKPMMKGNSRVAFDTFETLSADWHSTTIGWVETADAITPMAVVPMTDDGLVNPTIVVSPPWRATIGFESTKPWGSSEQAAISARFGSTLVRCRLACLSTGCQGTIEQDGTIVSSIQGTNPSPFSRITMSVDSNNAFGCAWDDSFVSSIVSWTTTVSVSFGVVASPGIDITYFEVIQ